jgi:hypothetical protein
MKIVYYITTDKGNEFIVLCDAPKEIEDGVSIEDYLEKHAGDLLKDLLNQNFNFTWNLLDVNLSL